MSDEEDTVVLLSEKHKDIEQLNTRLTIRQPFCVSYHNAMETSCRSHGILLLTSFVAALGGLSFGYDVGIGLNMVSLIRETFELTCSEQEVITSVWLIGAMVASFVGGIIVDGCGRRWAIICSVVLLILGSIISALANSFPLFLCGRFLGGFACALSLVSQSIYAAEVSEATSRGCAVILYQLGAAIGLLLSSIAGIGYDIRWQMVIWLSAIPAALQGLLILFFLPRSPHFKLLQTSQSMQTKHPSACCALDNLAELLLLALGLVFLQQLSGRSVVLYYAPRIFVLVGVCPDAAFTVAAIILNIIKVGAVSLSLCVVDKMGRRPCLIVGATCMMTSIALLGFVSSLEESDSMMQSLSLSCGNADVAESIPVLPSESIYYTYGRGMASTLLPADIPPPPFPLLPTPVSLVAEDKYAGTLLWCQVSVDTSLTPVQRYMALFAVICFEIAFSFGLAPITWLLLSEMFPVSVKGRAVALTSALHWLSDLVTPTTTTLIISTFTMGGALLCHSLICFITTVYVFLFIPETRSKSLHQIAHGLKNMSSKTRMFQNLQALPCLSKNTWLQCKARKCRRHVSLSAMESTVI